VQGIPQFIIPVYAPKTPLICGILKMNYVSDKGQGWVNVHK